MWVWLRQKLGGMHIGEQCSPRLLDGASTLAVTRMAMHSCYITAPKVPSAVARLRSDFLLQPPGFGFIWVRAGTWRGFWAWVPAFGCCHATCGGLLVVLLVLLSWLTLRGWFHQGIDTSLVGGMWLCGGGRGDYNYVNKPARGLRCQPACEGVTITYVLYPPACEVVAISTRL